MQKKRLKQISLKAAKPLDISLLVVFLLTTPNNPVKFWHQQSCEDFTKFSPKSLTRRERKKKHNPSESIQKVVILASEICPKHSSTKNFGSDSSCTNSGEYCKSFCKRISQTFIIRLTL